MAKNKSTKILECEKPWIFAVLIAVGGFLGAYTYTQRGGVFCNAQTANILIFAVRLGERNWHGALYYLIPISAYLAGAILSEFLPRRVNSIGLLRWDTALVGFEILCVVALGLIPDSYPPQISQVAVNFIASMQYNTFRQAKEVPMATTFCTNHLRQVGVHTVKWLRHRDAEAGKRLAAHFVMITSFSLGAVTGTVLGTYFGGRSIFGAGIMLAVVFIDLLSADLGRERGQFDIVPHGH